MTLDEYLAQFVEGYLFEDLRSMAAVKLTEPQIYGGVGYPMVATTLAGIELLGILTSDAFTSRGGDKRFRDFWQQYLYPHCPERQPIATAIYELVRHGLAHTYTPKPSFVVTKGWDGRHMCRSEDSFWIDSLTFADELIESYDLRVKPRLADAAFKRKMHNRFTEFRQVYRADYERMKSQLDQAPTTGLRAQRSGVVWAPNSLTVPTAYSTNVSSRDPFKS